MNRLKIMWNWTKRQGKKIAVFIFGVGIVSAAIVGDSSTNPTEIFDKIKVEETQDLQQTGKYIRQPYKKIDDKYSTKVDEYKTPDGKIGWQMTLWEDRVGDGLYIKAKGEGSQSSWSDYDWLKIKDYTASTTSQL